MGLLSKLVNGISVVDGKLVVSRQDGTSFPITLYSDTVRSSHITGKPPVIRTDVQAEMHGSYSIRTDGKVVYRENQRDIVVRNSNATPLQLPTYAVDGLYVKNSPFIYSGVPVYVGKDIAEPSQLTITHGVVNTTSVKINISISADSVMSDNGKVTIKSGVNAQVAKIDNNLKSKLSKENGAYSGEASHVIGSEYFELKNGELKYNNGVILTGVTSYTKYRNLVLVLIGQTVYAYRIGKYNRYVWKDTFSTGFNGNANLQLGYGNRTISIFHKITKAVVLKRFGVEKSVQLPSTVKSFSMLGKNNLSIVVDNGMYAIDVVASDVIAVDNDFFYSNYNCQQTISMSYEFSETSDLSIDGYGDTYKDVDGNGIKDIAIIGDTVYGSTGSYIKKITQTSGRIESATNTLAGTSQKFDDGIDGIMSIEESLYILVNGSLLKVNTNTLVSEATIDIESKISGKPRAIGSGPMGIAVLTDNGTVGIYSNIYTEPDKVAVISHFTSESSIAPVSSDGVWISTTFAGDNNAYNVLFKTGTRDEQIRIKSSNKISMVQVGSSMYSIDSSNGSSALKKYSSHVSVDKI